jgi:hypothetical protein
VSDNIIPFPKRSKYSEVPEDDIDYEIGSEYARQALTSIIMKMGTDFDKEEVIPMGMLVYESIVAYYLKTKGIYHPLHDIAEDLFQLETE